MNHYNTSLLNSPLEPLTYKSGLVLKTGTVVKVKVQQREQLGVVISSCEKPEFECLEIVEILDTYYCDIQLKTASFISSYYFCSLGEALGIMVPFKSSIPQASSKNMSIKSIINLSPKQSQALYFLEQYPVSLLFGDTGSGKTEIYMKLFAKMMSQGKRSIFLMPEISLTPQMSRRLEEHFGSSVVTWHSKLTPAQKQKALDKIHSGEAYIVAGPRSTLFLPLENIGVIAVDEEHDDSYKSSSRPRYNARDMAIYTGKQHDAKVVLGSATPSLSSYEKFPFIRLKGGYFSASKEFVYEKAQESLSPTILSSITKALKEKKQSIIFIPTRANFKYLICKECGHTAKCAFCSVGMSIHQKTNSLRCHYCNFAQAVPQKCQECGGAELTSSRMGTAEITKELRDIYPNATIEQFDRDTITTNKKLNATLERFNKQEIEILVGTQMLSKGHDYHSVAVAIVLGLDNILNASDHRAREKALSTLLQVAGRSGRKESAKVVVQSFNEEFFKSFIDDYELFLQDEKRYKIGLYPPYKKLCRVLFSHKNGIKAMEAMETMRQKLLLQHEVEVVGAGKCAIERVADKFRFEILLRADNTHSIIKAIRQSKSELAEIDMDPVEFS